MMTDFNLIYNQRDLFYTYCIFLSCTILMLIGSIISIHALTKKLHKPALLVGNILTTTAYIFNVVAVVGIFSFKGTEGKSYGYPVDLIEDCQEYPDHVFSFIVSPASRSGRPIVMDSDESGEQKVEESHGSPRSTSPLSTTEEVVTKAYNCQEMLEDIKWFKMTFGFIIFLWVVTTVTTVLSFLGLFHLCWINSRGRAHLILPPALVEPYEFYDELMRKNVSITSIPSSKDGLHFKKRESALTRNATSAPLTKSATGKVVIQKSKLLITNEADPNSQ